MSVPVSEIALREVLYQQLGIDRDLQLERPPTGRFGETFFASGPGLDRPLVVRIAPPDDRKRMIFYEHRMMRQEPGLHQLLRGRTSMPVPEIIHFEEQNELLQRDFVVMERLPGLPPGAASESLKEELGRKLREVHEIVRAEKGQYGYLGEHRPMDPQPRWREAFRVMWNALLDDIARVEGASADDIDRWRALFDRHADAFSHFREPACLLHMDVWAENILVDDRGRLSGLIDWDRALWGDPEIEFAVLEYCGIATPGFWRGYGRLRPADPDAQVRRVFYLAYEILKYVVIRIARHGDRSGAENYRSMAAELLEQLPL